MRGQKRFGKKVNNFKNTKIKTIVVNVGDIKDIRDLATECSYPMLCSKSRGSQAQLSNFNQAVGHRRKHVSEDLHSQDVSCFRNYEIGGQQEIEERSRSMWVVDRYDHRCDWL